MVSHRASRLILLLALAMALLVGALPTAAPAAAQAPARQRAVFFLGGVNTSSADGRFDALQRSLEGAGAAEGWGDPSVTTYHRFSYAYPALHYVCLDTWRTSIATAARRLDRQVADYVSLRPNTDIILIGHSQGGLIGLAYLALLKQSLHADWRAPAPGVDARLAQIVTLSAPLGGIPPDSALLGGLGAQLGADAAACETLIFDPANVRDMRAIWTTNPDGRPHGGLASVAQALWPEPFAAGGVRYANQQLAIDAGFASMRTLAIGNNADWVWSPCGRLASGIPSFLDTQWLTDMPASGIYGRAFTPADPRPCVTLADIPANHPATLYDPTVHAAILSFLNGGSPDQLPPAPPQ
jgi:pimeloyl-ACP methyl ester carboxylesterase